jgi:hypothetical protein
MKRDRVQRKYVYTYQIAKEIEPGKYEALDKHHYNGDMVAMRMRTKLAESDPEHTYVVITIPRLVKTYTYGTEE